VTSFTHPNCSDHSFHTHLSFVAVASLCGTAVDILPNAKWAKKGVTLAGENGRGSESNQLHNPEGLYVDDDATVYIADSMNHRIVEWNFGATSGQMVAGGNEQGNRNDQLNHPVDVIFDKVNDSLIICDYGNRRVVQWPRRDGTSGETIISNINWLCLTMDDQGFLYVSDYKEHTVRRWLVGDSSNSGGGWQWKR
jgi:sugar lactone lactonase YvrE